MKNESIVMALLPKRCLNREQLWTKARFFCKFIFSLCSFFVILFGRVISVECTATELVADVTQETVFSEMS